LDSALTGEAGSFLSFDRVFGRPKTDGTLSVFGG
jgi:hypothetical protein